MIERRENHVPIVLAFTADYFIPAAVCLFSIIKNAKFKLHFICLLVEDLPQKNKEMLQDLSDEAIFDFLNLGKEISFSNAGRFTDAAFYRLILPELLLEFEKVIYIDCDTIVRGNIGEIYDMDLEDYYLAGVKEIVLNFQEQRLLNIECEVENYMNSGFLLMNLKKFRTHNLVPILLDATHSDKYLFVDQDILNIYCQGKIKWLAPQYNSINVFRVPAYKAMFINKFSYDDWIDMMERGTLHYTGSHKPWDNYTLDFEMWWRYFKLLPPAIKLGARKNSAFWKMYLLAMFFDSIIGKIIIRNLKHFKNQVSKKSFHF